LSGGEKPYLGEENLFCGRRTLSRGGKPYLGEENLVCGRRTLVCVGEPCLGRRTLSGGGEPCPGEENLGLGEENLVWVSKICSGGGDNKNIISTTLIVINRGLQRTVRTCIDNTNTKVDKPWITEDCKNLYRQYKY
jgi:hypothetical protein